MQCQMCRRKVRESFGDKFNHMLTYHPDKLLNRVVAFPAISKSIGEQLADALKAALTPKEIKS